MQRHGIPAALDLADAAAQPRLCGLAWASPHRVKADGLAASRGGGGHDHPGPRRHRYSCWWTMLWAWFTTQVGARVIENFCRAKEASFIVLLMASMSLALATSQDPKRLLDRRGAPTPAAWARTHPAPVVTLNVHAGHACTRSSCPPIAGMASDGHSVTGSPPA